LRRYRQCAGDIVHGFDDANDLGMWTGVFKLLAPPAAREDDGGNGDKATA
jgi:hypothetical protein